MPSSFRACAYTPAWRLILAVLIAVSRASLPAILVMGLLSPLPVPLAAWVRFLGTFAVAPALLASVFERMLAVDVALYETQVVLERRGLRLEVPCNAIERITPWVMPLPGVGFTLWMRSGQRLRHALETSDPSPILSALAEVCGVQTARDALDHPSIGYARAKQRLGSWRWYHYLVKFVLFPLGPTAVWFNLNQHVIFGGLLGQYYLEGLGPYLKTFAIHWGLVIVYLMLYASVWRGVLEGLALFAAWVVPSRATAARWLGEMVCRVVYYVGVPVLVLIPFLQ